MHPVFLFSWWEKDQNILRIYPRFRGKQISELRAMPRVRSHSTHVFTALDGIIRNLSDEAASEQLLLDCKRDHLKYTESVTDDEYRACAVLKLSARL